MITLARLLCTAAFVLFISNAAPAQENVYEISIELDDATAADDDLLAAAAFAAPLGDVSQTIRKLNAGIVGEAHILMNQRIDTVGLLTLDDGSVVGLADGDSIRAKKKKACKKTQPQCGGSNSNGAVIFRKSHGGQPLFIVIQTDAGDRCRYLDFTGPGRPQMDEKPCGATPGK